MTGSNLSRRTVYLKDYQPPPYRINRASLTFRLFDHETWVQADLHIMRAPHISADTALKLHGGHDLELMDIRMDGVALPADAWVKEGHDLVIGGVPAEFELTTLVRLHPETNTSLMGLYQSSGSYCTQCEAEGFRQITYYIDRPDVLAVFTTTIEASRDRCPVLLSNGNRVASGELDGGRHWVRWHDPFPKPSYLFAMVAGDLACQRDRFVTCSGRPVDLEIYVQHHNADQCDHAMASLKKAMKWDEQVYGREYDLDVYMIVAVDDFNMGAMENKGLNIFNSKYVLARPEIATDSDYLGIEGVIAHEYFHNWSGNRVTCRDWFQLSLKEGFTVFRDQEFSADVTDRGVARIGDVNILRTHQFREDAGPMAHPVRPESYVEINNFYTLTVYNKGAEVVRMLANILGPERFRRGTDLYFSRHDGQAVTCDDFVKALEDANDEDFSQFRLWYSQAGTPRISVGRRYDAASRRYVLTLTQSTPPTPGQLEKQPFHIPVAVGLLDSRGCDMPLRLENEETASGTTRVLNLRRESEQFVFVDVPEEPLPSVLRGFSAPVRVNVDYSDEELAFLMAHDSDPFNRWEAGQNYALKMMLAMIERRQRGEASAVAPAYIDAYRKVLTDPSIEPAYKAVVLALPSETYIAEEMAQIDPAAIHDVVVMVRRCLGEVLHDELCHVYRSNQTTGPYSIEPHAIGRRALKNVCLGLIIENNDAAAQELAWRQFVSADNMTDVMAALTCLANTDCPQREPALKQFFEQWQEEKLVVDKWFSVQATSRLPDTLDRVRSLVSHPAFQVRNPNAVRALVGAFCHNNPVRFHDPGGAGYRFLTEQVLTIDPLNPQVAARLVSAFTLWRRYEPVRREAMKQCLMTIAGTTPLSNDVYEIVTKSLAESA